ALRDLSRMGNITGIPAVGAVVRPVLRPTESTSELMSQLENEIITSPGGIAGGGVCIAAVTAGQIIAVSTAASNAALKLTYQYAAPLGQKVKDFTNRLQISASRISISRCVNTFC